MALLGAALAVNDPPEPSMPTVKPSPTAVSKNPNANDPVEAEYEKLLEDDDAAEDEVDKWIKEANAFRSKGAPFSDEALNGRIEQRFAPIRKAYEDFLQRHPEHVKARLAYGSFLYETHDEEQGVAQWEKARQLDPNNPAAWNNLANHYGHRGPVKKAFEYYTRALELKPDEPVYLQNFATTLYLFRKDAMELYNINEPEVFNRALDLYRKALQLDPKNFPLATDYAQSYYGIKPLRTNDALAAWNYALKVANDDFEREGVYIHLARVELNSGQFDKARQHLNLVTNQFYGVLKDRLTRNLAEKERKATNAVTQVNAAAPPRATPPTAPGIDNIKPAQNAPISAGRPRRGELPVPPDQP
jgi:tetratricopeptide (TPR) repeat protein